MAGEWSWQRNAAGAGFAWDGPNFRLNGTSGIHITLCDEERERISSEREWIRREGRVERNAAPDSNGLAEMDSEWVDVFEFEGLQITRQAVYLQNDASAVHIRLSVSNGRAGAIRIQRLIPLLVEGAEHLRLGDTPASEWVLYSHGRYKNDVPSVCRLGQPDAAYRDALTGLAESGQNAGQQGELPSAIISDNLSVITSHIGGGGQVTLLLGFIDGRSQQVQCKLSTDADRTRFERLELACSLDDAVIKPGETRHGEWLRLDGRGDPFQSIARYIGIKSRITGSRSAPRPPAVYCTWYYYGSSVTPADVKENMAAIRDQRLPVDVFQIDDGWSRRRGDWEPNHKFGSGMKALAEEMAAIGLRPGIWTSPFILEPRCDLLHEHGDWLLKKHTGEPVRFKMSGFDHYVLDVTLPAVQAWLEALFRKLTHEWGYTYHKLDFTRAVVQDPDIRYADPSVTRAEAFRLGIEAVRRGMGNEAYFVLCGGLYDAAAGLVDGQRTGSDVRSIWPEGGEPGDEVVAPMTFKQNTLRYWMNALWHNDPDALMVRRRTTPFRFSDLGLGSLTDEEAMVSALNQYFGGGVVCFTEPLREIEPDRLLLLRHVIPSFGAAAIPRDLFQGKRFPAVYDVEVVPRADALPLWHTLTLVNWTNAAAAPVIRLDESLAGHYFADDPHADYVLAEFRSGRVWTGLKYGAEIASCTIEPHAARHYKLIRQPADAPVLLYSDGHFSMGGTEITGWRYEPGVLMFSAEWPWDQPLRLLLLAPHPAMWQSMRLVADGDGEAAVAWELSPDHAAIVEVVLPGRFNGTVRIDTNPDCRKEMKA